MPEERMIDWPPQEDQLILAAVQAVFALAVRWTGEVRVGWSLQEQQNNARFQADLKKLFEEYDRGRAGELELLRKEITKLVNVMVGPPIVLQDNTCTNSTPGEKP